MTALFHAMADTLWHHVDRLARDQGPERTGRPPGPATRARMADGLGWTMASAWLRKHDRPESPQALVSQILGERPAWTQALCLAWRCKKALEGMPEADYQWRPTPLASDGEPREGTNPEPGQMVLYYFDVVGTHLGYYAGEHTFCGLFGGFLGGDVSHWMPAPGLEDERVPVRV